MWAIYNDNVCYQIKFFLYAEKKAIDFNKTKKKVSPKIKSKKKKKVHRKLGKEPNLQILDPFYLTAHSQYWEVGGCGDQTSLLLDCILSLKTYSFEFNERFANSMGVGQRWQTTFNRLPVTNAPHFYDPDVEVQI